MLSQIGAVFVALQLQRFAARSLCQTQTSTPAFISSSGPSSATAEQEWTAFQAYHDRNLIQRP
jgi:hypothetical protein